MRNLKQKNGMALITVLLVMTMAVSLISFIFLRQDAWIRSVENSSSRVQAATIARTAINWMGEIAIEKTKQAVENGLANTGKQEVALFEVEGGKLKGSIEPVQGKLNLNNILQNNFVDQKNLKILQEFFRLIDIAPELAETLADWIDKDNDAHDPYGAEDGYYLSLQNPYRTANVMLTELNDLYMVKGFNKEVIDKLRPYAIALPGNTPVDVNAASAEVITSLFGGALPFNWGKTVVENRSTDRFESEEDFKKLIPVTVNMPNGWSISLNNWYYLVKVEARFQRARVAYEALIVVPEGYGQARIIWLKET